MDRILQWNTLQEAADYLSGELGGNWTPRQVLDAGEQQSFKVHFILPHDVKALAGRMEEWVGDKPELRPGCINELLNSERVRVGFVPFIEHATNRETLLELKPRPTISFDEIRIRGSVLKDFAASERAANKTPSVKILFEKHLCPREFGSAVFNVPALLNWAKGKGVCLPTEPPLDAYDFAQAEYVLSLVANFPFHNAATDEAAAHVATNPVLAQHKAAEVAPAWLAGAEAATQWRAAFSKAIANGELILLDRFSLLPVAIAAASAAKGKDTTSGNDWTEKARAIADECFNDDTKAGVRDSLATKNSVGHITGGYCFRVMGIMQERGIKGPRGIVGNPATIMREALQGKKWWANKAK